MDPLISGGPNQFKSERRRIYDRPRPKKLTFAKIEVKVRTFPFAAPPGAVRRDCATVFRFDYCTLRQSIFATLLFLR